MHFSTLLQEATKILDALPFKVVKFGGEKDKNAVGGITPSYSPTHKSWGINLKSEKKAQLTPDCYGGIVFAHDKSEASTKKIAFKIVTSTESGAVTFGVANS